MIIIGIDPGTAKIGFGVINKITRSSDRVPRRMTRQNPKTQKLQVVDYGCITTSPTQTVGERLKKINNELNKLIKKHRPKALAVENVYFFKNLKTVMGVSQAKGVILLTAAKKKIPVYEFTPLEVKMTVSGYGRASKKQVQKMVKYLLNLKKPFKSDDEADALGIAICGVLKIENLQKREKWQKN